jgi:hypothetical protein
MVLLALEAAPANLVWMKNSDWWLLIACVILGIVYSASRYGLYHSKLSPDGTTRRPILGGLWLKKTAKQSMKQNHVTEIDDLLDGAPGPQALWSGFSRFVARILVFGTFVVFVVTATASLMQAGLIVYVKTAGKPLF